MITLDELRARHEELTNARELAQKTWRDRDIGFAYTLGEVERLIEAIEAKQAAEARAAQAAAEAQLVALAEDTAIAETWAEPAPAEGDS